MRTYSRARPKESAADVTPVQTDPYPFWDKENGATRHLVEPCGLGQCSDVELRQLHDDPSQAFAFHAYTTGKWDFRIADMVGTATARVYDSGPVSWADARSAAIAGLPNPLSEDQLNDGTTDGRASLQLLEYKQQIQYYYFFCDELGWPDNETGSTTNYEPRYLEALMANHGEELKGAYVSFLKWVDTHRDAYESDAFMEYIEW
jgi:hypothetical protein